MDQAGSGEGPKHGHPGTQRRWDFMRAEEAVWFLCFLFLFFFFPHLLSFSLNTFIHKQFGKSFFFLNSEHNNIMYMV